MIPGTTVIADAGHNQILKGFGVIVGITAGIMTIAYFYHQIKYTRLLVQKHIAETVPST